MPTFDAGGTAIYYEEQGSGKPLVFVHGIPTDYRAWQAQMGPLSADRRAIAISRRYAYPNKKVGDVSDSTVQNNAADLEAFIGKFVGGPVDLVGHSYGGFAAAYLAASRPDLVNSLVLVEPAVSTLLVADQRSTAQSLGLLIRSPSVALSGRRFQTGSLGPSLRALESGDGASAVELNVDGIQDRKGAFRGFPEETRKMMADNSRTIAELKTRFPLFKARDAGKISRPCLVVNGEQSALWLRRIGEILAGAVPGAQRVLVPGSRHFPHMENAEFFNSKLAAFIGSVP